MSVAFESWFRINVVVAAGPECWLSITVIQVISLSTRLYTFAHISATNTAARKTCFQRLFINLWSSSYLSAITPANHIHARISQVICLLLRGGKCPELLKSVKAFSIDDVCAYICIIQIIIYCEFLVFVTCYGLRNRKEAIWNLFQICLFYANSIDYPQFIAQRISRISWAISVLE